MRSIIAMMFIPRARPVGAFFLAALVAVSLGYLILESPADAVVGGRVATPTDNPTMAALVRRGQDAVDSQFCGGTVISPTAVVTAAHCTEGLRAGQIDVITGGTNLEDPNLTRTPVATLANHPNYDKTRTLHDVSVLILATPVTVPAATLAGADATPLIAPGAILRLTGWGLQRYNDADSAPTDLRYADIPVVRDEVCQDLFPVYDASLQFCGQSQGNRPDSCQGDSGGPMLDGPAEAPRLVGIVSYGTAQCGAPGDAGVYVRVSSERAWIASVAGLGGPIAVTPVAPKQPVGRGVRVRFGQLGCDDESCSAGVRVSGKDRRRVAAVVVRVRRPAQRGYSATSLYINARKLAPGQYRARTTQLPYGFVKLTAIAVDAKGNQLGLAAREDIEVFED